MLLFVHLKEFGGEVRGVAVAEFLHGIHTGGLEQFGELRADAVDAEQVGVVDPGEDTAVVDTGRLFDGLTALGIGALLGFLFFLLFYFFTF